MIIQQFHDTGSPQGSYTTIRKGTAILALPNAKEQSAYLYLLDFQSNPNNCTVVDARNTNKANGGPLCNHAITIPLSDFHEWVNKIPTNKPMVVQCSAGYRPAAGARIIARQIISTTAYELGETVLEFEGQESDV